MDKVKINKADSKVNLFLDYINFLEGIKTHCKAMHWGIKNIDVKSKRGNHIYLDDFLSKITSYQDTIAEVSQGILGNYITVVNIKSKNIPVEINTPLLLSKFLFNNVMLFYKNLNEDIFVGIKSETETFIKDIQQFIYLFDLCCCEE